MNTTMTNNTTNETNQGAKLGRISGVSKNRFTVRFEGEEYSARLKGRLYNELWNPPVVGDYVYFQPNPHGDSVIISLCERSSVLKRSGNVYKPGGAYRDQVMVANVDVCFIVASLNENYNLNRIARLVSAANQGNCTPIVILTKADLCENPAVYVREVNSLSAELRVYAVSAYTGEGIGELAEYLTPTNTIVLLGSSGVGKSTLVNTIVGKEVMQTGEIRESDGRGRHTTTGRQMLVLDNGTTIIDTPGMREFGMTDAEEGLTNTFEDISELEQQCRFRDCTHQSEPGCAIKAAIKNGSLSEKRFCLYQQLSTENQKHVDKKAIAKARRLLK